MTKVWKSKIPVEVKICIWMTFHDKIQLKKRKWKGEQNCKFCGLQEMTDHVLFTCLLGTFACSFACSTLTLHSVPISCSSFYRIFLADKRRKPDSLTLFPAQVLCGRCGRLETIWFSGRNWFNIHWRYFIALKPDSTMAASVHLLGDKRRLNRWRRYWSRCQVKMAEVWGAGARQEFWDAALQVLVLICCLSGDVPECQCLWRVAE